MYVACSYHIVVTEERTLLVPRTVPRLTDSFADIRTWRLKDWKNHPDLARALVRGGHLDLVQEELSDRLLGELPRFDRAAAPEDEETDDPLRF